VFFKHDTSSECGCLTALSESPRTVFPEFTRNAHVRDAKVPSGSIKQLAGNVSERKVSESRVVSRAFFRYKWNKSDLGLSRRRDRSNPLELLRCLCFLTCYFIVVKTSRRTCDVVVLELQLLNCIWRQIFARFLPHKTKPHNFHFLIGRRRILNSKHSCRKGVVLMCSYFLRL